MKHPPQKTTLYIDWDVYLAAKIKAAQERTSVTALVERGLRLVLKEDEHAKV